MRRNILAAYAGVGIPAALVLLLYPWLVKNLGPEKFGLMSLLLSVSTFFSAFDFGIGTALARYVARLNAQQGKRLQRIGALVTVGLALQLCIGAGVGCALATVLLWPGREVTDTPEFKTSCLLVAGSIPFALVAGASRSTLEGLARFSIANALRASASGLALLAPVAVSFFVRRLDAMMLSLLLARIAIALVSLELLRRRNLVLASALTIPRLRRHGRVLLTYGGWVTVGIAAGGLITMGVLDRFIVGQVAGSRSIIEYSLASDVVGRCLLIPGAITSILVPLLAKDAVHGTGIGEHYSAGLRVMAQQLAPISALLVLNAHLLVGVLGAGQAGAAAAKNLQWMAIGLFVHGAAHVPYATLQALGRPRLAAVRHLIELPVYFSVSVALVWHGMLAHLGMLWAGWTIVDLCLITFFLGASEATLGLRAVLKEKIFLGWAALLSGALGLSGFATASWSAAGIVASALVALYWVRNVALLVGRDPQPIMGLQ